MLTATTAALCFVFAVLLAWLVASRKSSNTIHLQALLGVFCTGSIALAIGWQIPQVDSGWTLVRHPLECLQLVFAWWYVAAMTSDEPEWERRDARHLVWVPLSLLLTLATVLWAASNNAALQFASTAGSLLAQLLWIALALLYGALAIRRVARFGQTSPTSLRWLSALAAALMLCAAVLLADILFTFLDSTARALAHVCLVLALGVGGLWQRHTHSAMR